MNDDSDERQTFEAGGIKLTVEEIGIMAREVERYHKFHVRLQGERAPEIIVPQGATKLPDAVVYELGRGGFPPESAPVLAKARTAKIAGVEKRVTSLEGLNDRFALLQTHGSATAYISRADNLPIQENDLKRRLAGEVVQTGVKPDKEPIYASAYTFWTGARAPPPSTGASCSPTKERRPTR